jgi:hypothetical protein
MTATIAAAIHVFGRFSHSMRFFSQFFMSDIIPSFTSIRQEKRPPCERRRRSIYSS